MHRIYIYIFIYNTYCNTFVYMTVTILLYIEIHTMKSLF